MFQTKNMEKWINYRFDPVECRTGQDFTNFVRNLKAELTAQLQGSCCEIVKYSKGYFIISGFVRNGRTGAVMYFSIPDVREVNKWCLHILIRRAKDTNDYCGEQNHYTDIRNFGTAVMWLLGVSDKQIAA